MTNYKLMQKISIEEMEEVFYLLLEPFFNVENRTQEEKDEARQKIREFLRKEA